MGKKRDAECYIYSMTPFKKTCAHDSFPVDTLHLWKKYFKGLKSGDTNSFNLKLFWKDLERFKPHLHQRLLLEKGKQTEKRGGGLAVMNATGIVKEILASVVFSFIKAELICAFLSKLKR